MRSMMWDFDGRKVFAVEAGSGEPVLLLHGYPQSASCWRHQIAALSDNHHVVAPDWPGFGGRIRHRPRRPTTTRWIGSSDS